MVTRRKFEEKRYAKYSNDSNDKNQNCWFNTCFAKTLHVGKCYFCEEAEDHAVEKGPKGTQVVQYFAWKKVADMAPNERFQEIKRKGY